MKSVLTAKGNQLPLISLKGRDYLMVAYRLQWLTEDVERYTIDTEFLVLTDDQTVARATINLYTKDGQLVRTAKATKRETKKDFSDHTEKAETAAIGRALAMLGFGTQQAIADLDEGTRLADSPLESMRPKANLEARSDEIDKTLSPEQKQETVTEPPKSRTTFRKSKPTIPDSSINTGMNTGSSGSLNF